MNVRLLSAGLLLAGILPAQTVVETARVAPASVTRTVKLTGELLPYLSVDIQGRANAYIESVLVDRGSRVRKGQTLVRMNAPEMKAQIAELQAKVAAIEAQAAEAEAKLASAQSTYDRLKTASETPGAIAANELIVAEKNVAAAKAAVGAIEASKKAAEAAVQAQRDLEQYLTITAPFDGIVTERLVHPGALVSQGSGPLLRLEQHSRLRLVVAVPETDAGRIRPGTRVSFSVPAFPTSVFHGVVARVPRALDPKTRTMAVELDVASQGKLAPGMYPEVNWPVQADSSGVAVPPTAIASNTERTFVIKVENGRARWVNVRRGPALGEVVQIFGDVQAGDLVVKRATDELRDGTAVRAKQP